MIKFFRKIRQNLLLENKTGKYFKYAIGEIILVVIGILIALNINNWNESRKLEDSKLHLMQALKNELVRNKGGLEHYVNELNKSNSNFNKVLLYSVGDYEIPMDSLKYYLSNMIYPRTLSVVNAVQEEAINSGKFELLGDSLKASLSLLKDFTNSRSSTLDKGFDIYHFYNDRQTQELIARLYMSPSVPDEFNDHPSIPMHPDLLLDNLQLSTLIKEPDTYLNLKNINLTYLSDEIWIRYGLLRVTNETIEIIDQELKK